MKPAAARPRLSRRVFLQATGAAIAGSVAGSQARAQSATQPAHRGWQPLISLNTSTIRGHKLPIEGAIDLAAKAGYRGIEPWPDELDRYEEAGGSLRDLRKRLQDRGLAVTGAIAFYEWMVDDAGARSRAIEHARRAMARLAELGARHMAAPPAGKVADVRLIDAAERYRVLLHAGEEFGVAPAIEIWGFAENVSRLGEAVMIAIEADHPQACILPDVYHLYKGGSDYAGIGKLHGSLYAGFHLNDIPPNPPPRSVIKDADRIYPGDGVAPLQRIIQDLQRVGYTGPLSIELFNPEYYKLDPLVVARTALEKTRAIVEKALA